jgi:hypothetical protein
MNQKAQQTFYLTLLAGNRDEAQIRSAKPQKRFRVASKHEMQFETADLCYARNDDDVAETGPLFEPAWPQRRAGVKICVD